MARVRFIRGNQSKFLENFIKRTGLTCREAAKLCNVCSRTFRDWKRDKYQISYKALSKLCKFSGISIPKDIEILKEFWSVEKASVLGGKRYFELYGIPGNIESRRRGGINSTRKFMLNPEWAKERGFVTRKKILYPDNSELLAEFIGVMIGDGGIRNKHQITISYNWKEDRSYATYIQNIIKKLFGISSALYIREELGSADVLVTSTNLIEFLEKKGIKRGNKVVNQIDIPGWVFERREYQISCLKGLFDTDGCVYQHVYAVGGKKYRYVKMCFSNCSLPVLLSIKRMLENLNFHPIIDERQQGVYLNKSSEVERYFLEIGSSNPRYYNRYNRFFSEKIGRIGEVVQWTSTAVC